MAQAVPAFTVMETPLAGLRVLKPRIINDSRGKFVKTFHAPSLREFGIDFQPEEEFYSVSQQGVLRGLHFQIPPKAHEKTVTCLAGRALDVVTDLRKASPSYGRSYSVELSPERSEIVFIPPGFAHGFLALENGTLMWYQTSVAHAPECDQGISWNSIGFAWPCAHPVISARDAAFPKLSEFVSPF